MANPAPIVIIPAGFADNGTVLTAPDNTTSQGATRDQIITVDPTQLASVQTALADAEKALADAKAQAATLQTTVDTLTTQVAALQAQLNGQTDVDPFASAADFAALKSDVATLTASVTAAQADIATLKSQVAMLTAVPSDDDSAALARITALEASVASLTTTVAGIPAVTLAELAKDITPAPAPVTPPTA